MKHLSRLAALFVVFLMGIVVVPAMAGPTTTLVVTESQINPMISGLVYNYGSYTLSSPAIDFRMGLVRVNATLTKNGITSAGRIVLAPTVSGGKVSWTLVSATINGKPGTGAQFAFISTTLTNVWTSAINTYYSGLYVASVTVTETKITAVVNS